MCDKCGSVYSESHGLDAADAYRIDEAAGWVLGHYDIIELAKKEKNPLRNRDLVAMEVALSDKLRKIAGDKSEQARKIIAAFLDETFDVTDASAKELVDLVSKHFPKIGAAIAESAVPVTEETAGEIVRLARKHIGKQPSFSKLPEDWTMTWALRDEKALEGLARKPALWIGDYYSGPKIEQARGIIAKAMEAGLGRDQTAALLKEGLGAAFEDYRYWDVVSSTVSTKARGWSVLTSMQEAGYETYKILPMGDERVCETCIAMSVHEFKVAKAVSIMESTFDLQDPDAVKEKTPWLQWDPSRNNGNGEAYYMKGGRANYLGDRSGESLQNSGLGIVPLHGRCRCQLVLAD